MYAPGKVMKSGTAWNIDYPIANSAATTYVIDMTSGSPAWRQTPSMSFAAHRTHADLAAGRQRACAWRIARLERLQPRSGRLRGGDVVSGNRDVVDVGPHGCATALPFDGPVAARCPGADDGQRHVRDRSEERTDLFPALPLQGSSSGDHLRAGSGELRLRRLPCRPRTRHASRRSPPWP